MCMFADRCFSPCQAPVKKWFPLYRITASEPTPMPAHTYQRRWLSRGNQFPSTGNSHG